MIASEETDREGEAVSNCVGEDLSHSFEAALKDVPEVLSYIKRLNEHIKRQQNVLLKLYEKLKEYKQRCAAVQESKPNKCDATTQTECIGLHNPAHLAASIDEQSEWNTGSFAGNNLAEEVKKVAESAMQQTGFVYEETSGMYYDYNTGYYYNAELGLYYDGHSGTYMYYNEATKCYEYHSQAPTTSDHSIVKQESMLEVPAVVNNHHIADSVSNEFGKSTISEISNDKNFKIIVKDERIDCMDDVVKSFSQLSVEAKRRNALEASAAWPPCMRIIVQGTDVKGLGVGTLFIVTCKGGTLGREKSHAVCIPDINISKHHGKFLFNEEDDGKYFFIDYGSRNGTYINKKRLSAAKQESEPAEITHGTIVTLGSTDLLCHIHPGRETCEECEPGVVAAKIAEDHNDAINSASKQRENKSEMRKQELKRLRKRFGLESSEGKGDLLGAGYEDRAEIRRTTVGSQNEHAKTETASVTESIKSSNKGFEMLSKMGWKQGDSLGRDGTGLIEPVLVSQRADKAGLGSDNAFHADAVVSDPRAKRRTDMWVRAQHRYDQIRSSATTAAATGSGSGSESDGDTQG